MVMIRAIVRQEKVQAVVSALMDTNYFAMTKFSVFGRGRQRGLRVGGITYDELPKEMLMLVVPAAEQELVCQIIMRAARTGEQGAFGDGKIFVTPVEADYTIRTGEKLTATETATTLEPVAA
ncbi:MAG: P-II family nitrogen regulator [Verrucomicrobiae bacterium]|nr:P-II family nitrogen regulator [Verrucomicrobiae bacterium]MCP5524458.1 P-II family nitrogen regulator [Verrucomicrobiales bacterium]